MFLPTFMLKSNEPFSLLCINLLFILCISWDIFFSASPVTPLQYQDMNKTGNTFWCEPRTNHSVLKFCLGFSAAQQKTNYEGSYNFCTWWVGQNVSPSFSIHDPPEQHMLSACWPWFSQTYCSFTIDLLTCFQLQWT